MSSDADFLKWLKNNILSQSTQVEECLLGETIDFLSLDDTQFPRVEIQIIGSNGTEFIQQRQRSRNCIISIQGYLRREDRPYQDEDMYAIADFKEEIETIVYSIHNQVLNRHLYTDIPEKFVKLSAVTEAYVVHEIEPNLSSFIFNITGEFDT